MNPYSDTITMPVCVLNLIVQQKRLIENADRHIVELKEIVKDRPYLSVYRNGELIRKGGDNGTK